MEEKAAKKKPAEEVVEQPQLSYTKQQRRAADTIIKFLKEQKDLPVDVTSAMDVLERKRAERGTGTYKKPDNIKFFMELMKEKKVWTAAELYTRFQITKAGMGIKRKSALTTAVNPAQRFWVLYDTDTQTYTFKGKSEFKPKKYNGPLPTGYIEEA